MKFNLSKERESWATAVWRTAVEAKETTATTLKDYLTELLQPLVDNLLIDITDSWKPVDTDEVKARRQEVIAQLKELPVEKLEAIEAAIELAKEP